MLKRECCPKREILLLTVVASALIFLTGCPLNIFVNSCDDGNFCNGTETLVDGSCQPGTAVSCDDGVDCTVDSCNESTGSCDNIANDSTCDNGMFCDGNETCDPILDCQMGSPPSCDDGVVCTEDSCNAETDSCDNTVQDNSVTTVVTFDAIDASGGPVEVGDVFQADGVLFENLWVRDISDDPFHLTGAGSGVSTLPTAAGLNDEPPSVLMATVRFVDPSTGLPAGTGSIEFDAFDTEVGTTLVTVSAFGMNGLLLYEETFVTPPAQRLHVVIPVSCVGRIELSTDTDGADLDNLQWNR